MNRRRLVIALCILIAAGFTFALMQPISYQRPRGPVTIQFVHAVQVRNALNTFAEAHDGKFPGTLSELPPDAIPPEARSFRDPTTKQQEDWRYYPDYSKQDTPRNIILASPRAMSRHKRIVIFDDCSGAIIEEDRFVRQLSEQANNK